MLSILLPTDFSENSKNAIRYALDLFKHLKVEFTLLNVYQNFSNIEEHSVSKSVYNEILDAIKNTSEGHLHALLTEIQQSSTNPDHTFKSISIKGLLVVAVQHISELKNCDLIVMGTAGKSNKNPVKFGSNTFHVLKSVKCPVLAVPFHYHNAQPQHILFPTDYKIDFKQREMELLAKISPEKACDFTVLYVSKNKTFTMKQNQTQALIKETIPHKEIDFCIENTSDIALGIQKYISSKHTELLVMVNTHHSFWENLLFESNIDNVGIDLKIPLLVLQNTSRPLK